MAQSVVALDRAIPALLSAESTATPWKRDTSTRNRFRQGDRCEFAPHHLTNDDGESVTVFLPNLSRSRP
ncbi:MAG: hypothetical protein J7641_07435 [Cyanobacteria bacterium SID2]|nr:hypothetical protein [Cyanobacteria bacterium SID2]MBP0005501.1 hypothetical protein [Cyanobacteria bacterium SBC]